MKVAEERAGRECRKKRRGELRGRKSERPGTGLAFHSFPRLDPREQHNARRFARTGRAAGNRLRGHHRDDGRQNANGCASAHEDSMAGGTDECKKETYTFKARRSRNQKPLDPQLNELPRKSLKHRGTEERRLS